MTRVAHEHGNSRRCKPSRCTDAAHLRVSVPEAEQQQHQDCMDADDSEDVPLLYHLSRRGIIYLPTRMSDCIHDDVAATFQRTRIKSAMHETAPWINHTG